jgi:ascorbate-specific PTS system EIIC-type component UlaA
MAACLATLWAAGALAAFVDPEGWGSGNALLSPEYLKGIALGGLPIGFFGGRALLPAARSGGWMTALAVGFGFGMIAPPLGAIEVVLAAMLPFSNATSGFDDNVTGFLVLLPIALVYSYVVVILTIPAGLLWSLMVRAIPDHLLVSMDLRR